MLGWHEVCPALVLSVLRLHCLEKMACLGKRIGISLEQKMKTRLAFPEEKKTVLTRQLNVIHYHSNIWSLFVKTLFYSHMCLCIDVISKTVIL